MGRALAVDRALASGAAGAAGAGVDFGPQRVEPGCALTCVPGQRARCCRRNRCGDARRGRGDRDGAGHPGVGDARSIVRRSIWRGLAGERRRARRRARQGGGPARQRRRWARAGGRGALQRIRATGGSRDAGQGRGVQGGVDCGGWPRGNGRRIGRGLARHCFDTRPARHPQRGGQLLDQFGDLLRFCGRFGICVWVGHRVPPRGLGTHGRGQPVWRQARLPRRARVPYPAAQRWPVWAQFRSQAGWIHG